MRRILFITLCAVSMAVFMVFPAFAQTSLDQAAQNIESAIQDSMSRAGQQGQPTLGQLGGVQSGSSGSDAGGGAGGGGGGSGSSGGTSGGSGGGSGCFAPDTLVLMADGSSKAIKDIAVGDEVASWDFETGTQVAATVLHVYTVQRDFYYVVDGIHVTAEHPFCTGPGQYTEVRFLAQGTPVASVTDDGVQFDPVAEYARVEEAGTFYNMTVSDTHVFIVSPANQKVEKRVVHNKGGQGF